MSVDSKSTDKLAIIMEGINNKILTNEKLVERILKIEIEWGCEGIDDEIVVPRLNVEFKE